MVQWLLMPFRRRSMRPSRHCLVSSKRWSDFLCSCCRAYHIFCRSMRRRMLKTLRLLLQKKEKKKKNKPISPFLYLPIPVLCFLTLIHITLWLTWSALYCTQECHLHMSCMLELTYALTIHKRASTLLLFSWMVPWRPVSTALTQATSALVLAVLGHFYGHNGEVMTTLPRNAGRSGMPSVLIEDHSDLVVETLIYM